MNSTISAKWLFGAFIFITAFVGAYFPTLHALHNRWSAWTESYSHGYLLLAVAIFLYIDTKQHAPRRLPDFQVVAPFFLIAGSLSWAVFYLSGITILQQLLLPPLVLATLASLLDRDRVWRAVLPISLIFLAIPVWDDFLIPPLQAASAAVSAWVVGTVFHIPTAIDGIHISIPSGTFEVASGCAGLVFLLSAVALGMVYGQLFLYSRTSRLVAIVIAAVLGILVNWVRIISLIVIGQYSRMQHPLITEGHLMFGWYLFSGTLLIVIVLTQRSGIAPPAAVSSPPPTPNPVSLPRVIGTLFALIVGPILIALMRLGSPDTTHVTPPDKIGKELIRMPARLDGFIGPTINTSYRYALEPGLSVNIVFYRDPFGRGKLLSQSNRTVQEDDTTTAQSIVPVSGETPSHALVNVSRNRHPILIASWYQLGSTNAPTVGEAKWAQLRQAIRGRLGGAYVQIEMPCQHADCAIEQYALERQLPYLSDSIAPLVQSLTNAAAQ